MEAPLSDTLNDGAGLALPPDPALSPCPFDGLPQPLHEYMHNLERRVAFLEIENKRFVAALKNAGNFIFNSPQGKMISIAFPKEVQAKLKEFFNGEI